MPAKSAKQFGLMLAASRGRAGGLGAPSQEVGKEFVRKTPKDKKKAFAKALMRKRK